MTIRKRASIGLALLLAVAGVSMTWIAMPHPQRVTLENGQRIHAGMSRAEVVDMIGEAGDHRTRPTHRFIYNMIMGPSSFARWELWQGDTIEIELQFDEHGVVAGPRCIPVTPTEIGAVELLRWRVNQAWHRWTGR
jgi:hypothetical protein